MQRVAILGTGPAGLTAALYLARADMKPLVIEGFEPGGQLTLTTDIENFPGFLEGDAHQLIQNMRKQATNFGAEFKTGRVSKVKLNKRPFQLIFDDGKTLDVETLIIATGASARWLEIPGESDYKGEGISTCATCDGFFYRNKSVIVVGGGDSAMEEAIFLTKFADEVKLVHRRSELRASKIMQDRAKANKKITWMLDRAPLSIHKEGGQFHLVTKNNDTDEEETIVADGVFLGDWAYSEYSLFGSTGDLR